LKHPIKNSPFGFITSDSRECDGQTAFLADKLSHPYTQAAKKAGAPAVLIPADLSRYFSTDIQLIGITGTNGKTTTAALIYSILLDLGFSVAMQGTRGFFINGEQLEAKSLTTPMLLEGYAHIDQAAKAGCDFFVMEVSSHAIEQERIAGLGFALKIHTNITGDHLDYHGSFENYRAVKNSFFADEGLKLINRDDPALECNMAGARSYALESAATFKVEAYSPLNGLSGVLTFGQERALFYSDLVGVFNLYNIAAAIGAVKLLTDRGLQTICDQVENFGGVSGRMERVSDDPAVVIDFAHTADGIEKALSSLAPAACVALFGAGGDRDRTKRPLMGQAAARWAKRIILTSDNPRHEDPEAIIDEIAAGIPKGVALQIEADRAKAITQALENLADDEILVILGKGDETAQIVGDVSHPFSDKEQVLKYLKERAECNAK
jgi:UDP-N-acetylmuramoyl-L-alanyl-D-glutamate--2,6-diaminopimelate ligase